MLTIRLIKTAAAPLCCSLACVCVSFNLLTLVYCMGALVMNKV